MISHSERLDLRRGPMLWIQLAWGLMLVSFALGVPIYQAPDEPLHVDRILDVAGRSGFQEYDENTIGIAVARSQALARFAARPTPFDSSNVPPEPRPSFADLGGELSGAGTNQLNQHPPTYYALISAMRTAVTGMLPSDLWPFDRDVLLLRLMNVMMMLPLPALCALAAANLRWPRQRQLVAALFPLCVPQLAHIGSTVNNDNLLVLSASVALAVGAGLLVDGLGWRRGLVFAAAVAVALMTKATGLVLAPLILAVCWKGVRRCRSHWRIAAVILGAATVSSWFYLRSLILFGTPRAAPRMLPQATDVPFDLVGFVAVASPRVMVSFWSRFGVLWIEIPRPWVHLLSVAIVASVALSVLWPRRPGLRMMMAPVGLGVALLLATVLPAHLDTGLYPGLQGRYFFVLLVPLALAVTRSSELIHATIARRILVVVVVVNFVMSVVQIGRTFWGGSGVLGRLASVADWSPVGVSGVVVLVVAVIGVLIAVASAERAAVSGPGAVQKGPD